MSSRQHAFIPRHGVDSICHQLVDTLRRNLKNGRHNLILSEDIGKVFNRIVSAFVIMELHEWNIPHLSSESVQRLRYPMDNGVSQGSPLSVVFYSAYANSLAKILENLSGIDYIGVYAENNFAVVSGNPEVVRLYLNNLDYKINQWAESRSAEQFLMFV